jgi:hypothetical protein
LIGFVYIHQEKIGVYRTSAVRSFVCPSGRPTFSIHVFTIIIKTTFNNILKEGTYKVRNEIETKRNENETKRNENETKRNEINEVWNRIHCRQRAPVGIDLSSSGTSQLGMFDIQATTKSKYYDHIVLLYLESRRWKELYLETFAMDRQTGQKQSVVTEGKMCLFILVNFPFKWFSCFR